MKIALLADRSDIHTVRWVNGLSKRGYSVHLITMNTGGDSISSDVCIHQLSIGAPIGYYLNSLELKCKLKSINPDLFHAHFASGYGTLARLGGIHPYLLSVWGRDVYEFPYRSSLHRRVLSKNLRAPDHLCSTSYTMADQTQSLGPHPNTISVTPFGVDTDLFHPDGEDRMGIVSDGDEPVTVIGTVKKLHGKYGIDILIRAFAQFRNETMNENERLADSLRLLIIGDGPLREDLEELTREIGVEEATFFTGAVPHKEVPAYLRTLDVYVATSRSDSESFGVAILEASACECPVVVSEVGGLPEVVGDRTTGLVVPSEDTSATAEAIATIVRSVDLRNKMGRAGRARVIEKYGWDACLDRMESVYQGVVNNDTDNLPIR